MTPLHTTRIAYFCSRAGRKYAMRVSSKDHTIWGNWMGPANLNTLTTRAHSQDGDVRRLARIEIGERFPIFARLICNDREWYLSDAGSGNRGVRVPTPDFAHKRNYARRVHGVSASRR